LMQRGTQVSFGIMLKFVTIAALATVAASSHEMMKKIHKDMMVMNSMTACWGKGNMLLYKVAVMEATEQCMQENHSNLLKPANPLLSLLNQEAETLPFPVNNNNPFLSSSRLNSNPFKSRNSDLNLNAWSKIWNSRSKRQVEGLLQPTEEDFKEFLADFEDFKGDIASKMGNLTCVMKKMDMLDNNLQVNMKAYTGGDLWDKIDLSQTMAGEDAEWRDMLETHYKDCYDIARSFPQSALNRNPLTKVFGRHMVFFKCAKKAEAKCCGMACANDMLETLYGKNDNYDWTQHGMPQNKYERAAWTMKIMYGTASHEEAAIHEFFFSDPMM
jgi:hypothetical protein